MTTTLGSVFHQGPPSGGVFRMCEDALGQGGDIAGSHWWRPGMLNILQHTGEV